MLRSHGIEHALIDTGEISTLGNRTPHEDWTIGIQHPRDEDAYVSLTKLGGRSLATSGDYATTFTPDRRHHHLFNPHTGHSPVEFSSVSIVAQTALTADMLSTALFVMGLDRGLTFLREFVGVNALIVLKNGQIVKTARFGGVERRREDTGATHYGSIISQSRSQATKLVGQRASDWPRPVPRSKPCDPLLKM